VCARCAAGCVVAEVCECSAAAVANPAKGKRLCRTAAQTGTEINERCTNAQPVSSANAWRGGVNRNRTNAVFNSVNNGTRNGRIAGSITPGGKR